MIVWYCTETTYLKVHEICKERNKTFWIGRVYVPLVVIFIMFDYKLKKCRERLSISITS
jgi:uncharacterized membrane protein (UPF0127 family)